MEPLQHFKAYVKLPDAKSTVAWLVWCPKKRSHRARGTTRKREFRDRRSPMKRSAASEVNYLVGDAMEDAKQ